MKIKFEEIIPDPGQSFKLFAPSLRNYFYWHYHPNYELVYVEATAGIRHVGQHVSNYMESDLILIGPNIPHLNFDYGLKTEYKQIVVQMKENFLGDSFKHTPELNVIEQLFKKAIYGLSFTGETKQNAAVMLKEMHLLDTFEQLLLLLRVFQLLAKSNEVVVLNDLDTSIKIFLNDKIRMGTIYEYIHANFNQTPSVNDIAFLVNLSTAAFCRYFKKQTKMTFTDFVNQYRVNQAKTLLLQDRNVSEACYEVGFESLSYFNKVFKKNTGENPSEFKRHYLQK